MEQKWQKRWERDKVFEAEEDKGKKFYVLEMYPYPSGSGLHIGHAFNYVIGDILARFKRMKGFNVLHPMGYDSFGLPAENAAIKSKSHPRIFTDEAISNFIRQQISLGLTYDWRRKLQSHDPEYYRWNQFFFLEFLKKGLVYRKKSSVNWCKDCSTVLANEQVHQGFCWRHNSTPVEVKQLEQWFLKTTAYADELLKCVDGLNWPERIKAMQRNWIGKSEGSEVIFEVNGQNWEVFTTRADTLMGVTFLVVSAQHPKLDQLVTKDKRKEVDDFLKKLRSTKQEDIDQMEKEGVFTGSYAKHPLIGEKIPIWVGNFVVADYGSGMVMAVPAHDQRDFEFAKKYGLPIKEVVMPVEGRKIENRLIKAFTEYGKLINSSKFDGLDSLGARKKITDELARVKKGRSSIQYKLRDWLVSRQRYWGTPIPIVYCDDCGAVSVPEKDLPVLLPEKVKFGEGNPLATSKEFLETKCPKCGNKARRETDTMDTFFDSSWYYLRFTDNMNKKEPFSKKKAAYWMPVDFYVGGAEHACMHLIYARFFTKALRDFGYLNFDEPFPRLYNQGMIHGEDWHVMSKSIGNVVDPLDASSKYGVDALRMFLVSMASPDKDTNWNQNGLESVSKLIKSMVHYAHTVKFGNSSKRIESKIHSTLKSVSEQIEGLKYNSAVIQIRALFESFEPEISKKDFQIFLKMISPFCPHLAEELWEKIGGKGFISLAEWPKVDEGKIDLKLEEAEKAVEKTVSDIINVLNLVKEKQGKEAEKVYLYVIPNEIEGYDSTILSRRVNKEVVVYAVNDKQKYDPSGKAGKSKPGKPGIYVE
ncbi:leucine--tRNA ligase [Candidatus Pacearchaeota archaeon]|nr:leucine--tRNA ligase [Candidatus Pacearchaeota archaeon]